MIELNNPQIKKPINIGIFGLAIILIYIGYIIALVILIIGLIKIKSCENSKYVYGGLGGMVGAGVLLSIIKLLGNYYYKKYENKLSQEYLNIKS